MSKIKPGDVGFIMTKNNIISKVMAWFMRSKFSHTFMILAVTPERIYTIETSDFEVVIGDFADYLNSPNHYLELYHLDDAFDSERAQIIQDAYKTRGTIYGYLQVLLSFSIRSILKRFGIRIKNFVRQGMVCCAVVGYGYQNSSVPDLHGIDAEGFDTEEYFQIISNSNAFTRII